MQISGWPGGLTGNRRPQNTKVLGGDFDSNILYHGIRNDPSARTPDDRDRNILIKDTTAAQFQLLENVQGVVMRGNTGHVRISGRKTNEREGLIKDVLVEDHEYDGMHRNAPVSIDFRTNSGALVENLEFKNIRSRTTPSSGAFIRILSHSNNAIGPVEWLTLRDSPVNAQNVFQVEDGISVTDAHLIGNDLRAVSSLTNAVNGSVAIETEERNRGWP